MSKVHISARPETRHARIFRRVVAAVRLALAAVFVIWLARLLLL